MASASPSVGFMLSRELLGPTELLEQARRVEDAGFDHVPVHDVGADPDGFFEFYEHEVLPELE